MSEDVLIKIVTAFESGGIDAAKKAAQELQEAVGKSSEDGKALGNVLDFMNGHAKEATVALRGLSGIMKGGFSATGLGAASNALKALGPWGMAASVAIQAAGVAWDVYAKRRQAAAEAERKAAEEAAKAAEEAAQAAKKHLEELDKARLEAVNAAVNELKEGLDAVAKAAEASRKNLNELEDSRLGVDTSEIDAKVAAGEMTAEEGEHAKAQLRFDAADRKDQREMDDLDAEHARLVKADADAAKAAEDAENALVEAAKELQSATARLTIERRKLAANPENVQQAQRVIAAQERKDAAAAAVEAAGTKKQAADAAAQSAVDARFDRGAEISQRQQILQNTMTARSFQRSAEESKYESKQEEKRLKDAETKKAEDDAAWKKYDDERAAAASTPRALSAEVGGMVGIGQRYGDGQLYDIDGGATRRQAMGTLREAVNAAAASKGGDAEEAAIIGQAVDAIQSMGANLLADKAQINAKLQELVNAIQKVESQTKNARS